MSRLPLQDTLLVVAVTAPTQKPSPVSKGQSKEMGGGRNGQKRGRTQRRHFRQSRDNVWKKSRSEQPSPPSIPDGSANSTWQPFQTQNAAFEEYYKEQGIVPEEEWDEFLQFLRQPLPAAFRINSSAQFFEDILSQLENDFAKSLDTELEFGNENEAEAIRPLPWYPNKLAWHLNFSRMQLRKNQTLERFHEFLKQENEIGNITRQEAVSMVPPLFLDVQPDHFVLDMCAAPGSKTFQLLEVIHQSSGPGSLPDGLVIANDVDVQRCNLLIHQTKRMCSANLIVTNHEAQHFPGCHLKSLLPEKSNLVSLNDELVVNAKSCKVSEEPSERTLLFDRILCDVPCSGDGTLRKAPDIWRKWNSGMGNGVHRLQVQIAMRGLALLKVGGRMVYSTCSMNPVENEAVIAEVLRKCDGAVMLVDVSSELPQLVRRPGLKKWKIRDKGTWFVSYRDVPKYRRNAVVSSMFPSGQTCDEVENMPTVQNRSNESKNTIETESNPLNEHHPNGVNVVPEYSLGHTESCISKDDCREDETKAVAHVSQSFDGYEEEVSSFPLELCMRILPHDQNSGAFFIAVLHKLLPLPAFCEKPASITMVSGKERNALSNISSDKTKPLEASLDQDLIVDQAPAEVSSEKETVQVMSISREVASGCDEMPGKDNDLGDAVVEDNNLNVAKVCDDGESGLESTKSVKGRLQIQGRWRGVDPVVIFKDDSIISSIRNFYGVSDLFPLEGHLVTRNNDAHHVKRIYYVSRSVHDILKLNFQVGQPLKITSLGLKMFERQTSKEGSLQCAFRISSEGLPLLLPYMSKQILYASLADFDHLLRYRTIKFADLVDADFREKASNLMIGCCVVVLNKGDTIASEANGVDGSTIAIGCWKGKSSLSIMVSQVDCRELLGRFSTRLGIAKDSSVQAADDGSNLAEDERPCDTKPIENLEEAHS